MYCPYNHVLPYTEIFENLYESSIIIHLLYKLGLEIFKYVYFDKNVWLSRYQIMSLDNIIIRLRCTIFCLVRHKITFWNIGAHIRVEKFNKTDVQSLSMVVV